MLHPTIEELTKGEYNRYELALATAKCARLITDEYVKQRTAAETALTGSKEGGSTIASMIDQTLANEKAVKIAIGNLEANKYIIVDAPEAAEEEQEVTED
jgi:pyrimidine operon attenuation protein/uracil phosphoribosyltransferase